MGTIIAVRHKIEEVFTIMKEALQIFWKFLTENFEMDAIIQSAETYEINTSLINDDFIFSLTEEKAKELLGYLTEVYMDVSGNDNYGEVYEILQEITSLDENEIEAVLD